MIIKESNFHNKTSISNIKLFTVAVYRKIYYKAIEKNIKRKDFLYMLNIAEKILLSIGNNKDYTQILENDMSSKKNELLFFFKPETFFAKKESSEHIINLVLEKLKQFNVDILNITSVSGSTLKKHEIMDKHYGFINTVSKNASKMLTEEDKKTVCDILGIELTNDLQFYGGHEYLEANPEFTPASLNEFWLTKKSLKLKSGFYFQNYERNGENIILIDAFHPSQLAHFTDDGRNIVLMRLSSDTDWDALRNDLVGDTFPDKANPTSLRGEIFNKRNELELDDVSISNNFCHLSAGAFEAFLEINNFYSKMKEDFDLTQTNVFKELSSKGLNEEEIMKSITNPVVNDESLFDATEHKNTDEALEIYISIYR